VDAFTARADLRALRDYWRAVGDRTLEIVVRDGDRGWEEPVDPARMRRIICDDGDYGPLVDTNRVQTFYAGMTRAWAFGHLALTHTYAHLGEAGVVRGMLGYPGV